MGVVGQLPLNDGQRRTRHSAYSSNAALAKRHLPFLFNSQSNCLARGSLHTCHAAYLAKCVFQDKMGLDEIPSLNFGGEVGQNGGKASGGAGTGAGEKTLFSVNVTGFNDKSKIKVR